MVLVLPHLIALHSVIDGGVLWQRAHRKEQKTLLVFALFVTNTFTGYLNEFSKIKIYGTANGQFIKSFEAKSAPLKRVTARGPYLCYIVQPNAGLGWPIGCGPVPVINLYKVTSQNVFKPHEFTFPIKNFASVKNSVGNLSPSSLEYFLFGFLGKSNILVGRIRSTKRDGSPVLFSLDIDAATRAKSREQVVEAFSAPLAPQDVELNKDDNTGRAFKQVYQTDISRGCVDLVGIMRKTRERSAETHIFVTEMQFSSL